MVNAAFLYAPAQPFFAIQKTAITNEAENSDQQHDIDPKLAPFFALRETDERVVSTGYRLLAANTLFCKNKIWNAGWQLHTLSDYGGNEDAARAYNLRDGFTGIAAVAANSPAERAGFKTGDLLQITDKQIKPVSGKQAVSSAIAFRPNLPVEERPAISGLGLLIKRIQPMPGEINIALQPTCASRFQVEPSRKRGASADGELVSITSTLAELTRDDDELATILAHEIAHNLLQHPQRLEAANISRGLLGQVNGDAAKIRQTEIEADRLSVWLMANAGYDVTATIRFWTFYGKKYGKGIFSAPTHFRWKKRVALFEEEIAKLKATPQKFGAYAPPLLDGQPPAIRGSE